MHRLRRRRGKMWRVPLRLRLALWSAGLVLFWCIALLFFVNAQAREAFPNVLEKQLINALENQAVDCSKNGQCVFPTVMGGTASASRDENKQGVGFPAIEKTLSSALGEKLGMISLMGLGLVVLLSGAGAYLLSGFALRPLRRMSETARCIHSHTLHTRLAWQGPQDEVRELADTFDAMLERLEHTFEAQKRFVGDVSHELRTPLASLRTNIEVVATDDEATTDDYRTMIATQERALTRLERLVSDLLLLATSEHPVPRERVVLAPVIEDIMQDFQWVAQKQQIELSLRYEGDVVVAGDSLLLARVFSNLIENAISYNRQGGRVIVTLTQNACQAIISVADTGIGIPSDQQTAIFERFYRVDSSRSRHRGGAGLGLSLVQAIARQHGGTVQVESKPGSGSMFTVQLPLAQENIGDPLKI